MNKVAILTHPLAENYGGILQATALHYYLSSLGLETTLLRKHRKTESLPPLLRVGRLILEKTPFQNRKGYRFRAKTRKQNELFIKRHIPGITGVLHTLEEVARIVEEGNFDAVIVGSDQVWRMKYIDDGHYLTYFLGFPKTQGMKKIAYAASFGTETWEAPEKNCEAKHFLTDFDAISVRETSGIDILRNNFNIENCRVALDPTLLLGKEFFLNLMVDPPKKSKGSLLAYLLDSHPGIDQKFLSLASAKVNNAHVFHLMGSHSPYKIESWLAAFHHSRYVITDSFHGMVFSIIFNKPFAALGNQDRGLARFESLLDLLGLSDRLARNPEDILAILSQEIDFCEANKRLLNLREESIAFLRSALDITDLVPP